MKVEFEALAGLPGTGPYPEQFTTDGRGTSREGLVVRFGGSADAAWVGNFQRGITDFSTVVLHPDGAHVLVVAGGQAYVVDPHSRVLHAVLGGSYQGLWEWPAGSLHVLDHSGVAFDALGPKGIRWSTRRISWDGFRRIEVSGNRLRGEAWTPLGDYWVPFEIDLLSGKASGGSYQEPRDLEAAT